MVLLFFLLKFWIQNTIGILSCKYKYDKVYVVFLQALQLSK